MATRPLQALAEQLASIAAAVLQVALVSTQLCSAGEGLCMGPLAVWLLCGTASSADEGRVCAGQYKVQHLLQALSEMAHTDDGLAHSLWVLLLPIIWATLGEKKDQQVSTPGLPGPKLYKLCFVQAGPLVL